MLDRRIDLMFLPISGDLEYLTGVPRREPSFGNVSYRHGWIAVGFFAPGRDPVLMLPRMITEFELDGQVRQEVIVVRETDDARRLLMETLGRFSAVKRLAVGARTWAETVVELQRALQAPELSNADQLISPLRQIKDSAELDAMRRAAVIVDQVMGLIGPKVRPGVTEIELAAEINLEMKRRGSRIESFDTGVISISRQDQRDAGTRVSTAPIRQGT